MPDLFLPANVADSQVRSSGQTGITPPTTSTQTAPAEVPVKKTAIAAPSLGDPTVDAYLASQPQAQAQAQPATTPAPAKQSTGDPTIDAYLAGHFNQPAPEKPKPEDNSSDVMRGASVGLKQAKQTFGGAVALIGDTIGSESVKKYGLDIYQQVSKEIEAGAKPSDEFTNVMSGKGDFTDWLQYSAGYLGGMALESIATMGAGAVVGSVGGPGGTFGGAIAGIVGKKAVKEGISSIIEKQLEKRVALHLAENIPEQQARQMALKDLSTATGAGVAAGMFNTMQEVGSIYPEALDQAHHDGKELTGADLAKVWATGIAASAVDTGAEMFGASRFVGAKKGGSLVTNVAKEAFGQTLVQSGTEGVQTVFERLGAGQNLTDAEAIKDYVNSMAVGALGGIGLGGAAGAMHNVGGKKEIKPVDVPADETKTEVVGMKDEEFFGLSKEKTAVPYLAAMYNNGDENTRTQLQYYATKMLGKDVDLSEISKNESVVNYGNKLVNQSPTFDGQFQERLATFYKGTANPPREIVAEPNIDNAPLDPIPRKERVRLAQNLANEGMLQRSGELLSKEDAKKKTAPSSIDHLPQVDNLKDIEEANRQSAMSHNDEGDFMFSRAKSQPKVDSTPLLTDESTPISVQTAVKKVVTDIIKKDPTIKSSAAFAILKSRMSASPTYAQHANKVKLDDVKKYFAQEKDTQYSFKHESEVQKDGNFNVLVPRNPAPKVVKPENTEPGIHKHISTKKLTKINQEKTTRFNAQKYQEKVGKDDGVVGGHAIVSKLTDKRGDGNPAKGIHEAYKLVKDNVVVGKIFGTLNKGYVVVTSTDKKSPLEGSSFRAHHMAQSAITKYVDDNKFKAVDARAAVEPHQLKIALEPEKDVILHRYQAAVQRIMLQTFSPSKAGDTLSDVRGKIQAIYDQMKYEPKEKQRSDVEHIFENFGEDAIPDAVKAELSALHKSVVELQNKDVSDRAKHIVARAEAVLNALYKLQGRMMNEGFSQSEIKGVVGKHIEGVQAVMSKTTTQDIVEADHDLEENLPQDELTLGFDESDRINTALQALEVSEGDPFKAFWGNARGGDEFSFGDLRQAVAISGGDLTQMERVLSQEPATQMSLRQFQSKMSNVLNGFSARNTWMESYDKVSRALKNDPEMLKFFEDHLSAEDKEIVKYMHEKRGDVKHRRNEQTFITRIADPFDKTKTTTSVTFYQDIENAFPSALFNNYSFDEMVGAENIAPSDKQSHVANDMYFLKALTFGEVKHLPNLWLDDVIEAMTARPDLKNQLQDSMPEEVWSKVLDRKDRVIQDMTQNAITKKLDETMAILDEIKGLSRQGYENFVPGLRKAVISANYQAVPKILDHARAFAKASQEAKDANELSSALDQMLDNFGLKDEMNSEPVGKSITYGKSVEMSKEDIDAVLAHLQSATDDAGNERLFSEIDQQLEYLRSLGEDVTREDVKQALMIQKLLDNELNGDNNLEQQAADASYQPENNVRLNGDYQFKRGGRYSSMYANDTITAHLTELVHGWEVQPDFEVYYDPSQIPDPVVRKQLMKRYKQGAFKGVMDTNSGKVYLFSQQLESTHDAEFVLLHELYGHWGLRYFLGDRLNTFLETQYSLNQQVRETADAIYNEWKNDGNAISKIEAIEEAISDLAAKGQDSGLFRDLMGRLVQWLRAHNMSNVADWIDSTGDKELSYVLRSSRSAVHKNQGLGGMNGVPNKFLFARNKPPVEIWVKQNGVQTGFARINPLTANWTVFTKDPKTGDYSATTVEDYAQAKEILDKFGKPFRTTDHVNRVKDLNPNNMHDIPDYSNVTGWKKFMRNTVIQLQNQFLPVFEVAKFLTGKGIENNVIETIKAYDGKTGEMIRYARKNFFEPIHKLMEQVGKLGGNLDEVDRFLLARHAKERNDRIKVITEGHNPQGSGMSTDLAKELLDTDSDGLWSKYRSELEQIGKLFDQMSAHKVQYMNTIGQINDHTAATLSAYKHYVNLSGNAELKLDQYDKSHLPANGFNFKGSEVRTAMGRGTEPVDVVQNTWNAYVSTLIRGQKELVKQAIYDMLRQNPDPNFVTINEVAQKKQLNVEKLNFDKKILKAIGDKPTPASGKAKLKELAAKIENGPFDSDDAIAELTKSILEAEARRDLDPADVTRAIRNISEESVIKGALTPDGYVSMVEDPKLASDDNTLIVRIGGKAIQMHFTDRGVAFVKSISGAGVERPDMVNAIGAWNRFFSQMVTSWNPAWIIPNGFRDIMTAFSNASADPEVGPVLAKKMMKEWMPSLHTAFRFMVADQADTKTGWWGAYLAKRAKNKQVDPKELKLYNEYLGSGAQTFFLDRDNIMASLEKLNRQMNGATGILEMTKEKLQGIESFMELMSMPMETAPRFAMFKVMKEHYISQGIPEAEAISKAGLYSKDLTVNFNMKGASQHFRSLYVFANPAVQGTFRMFQNYSRGEDGVMKFVPSNQFMATAGAWVGIGFMGNLMARMIGGPDDDLPEVDKLDRIAAFKRSTSLIIAPDVPGMAIPIPYGWNVIATTGHYLFDTIMGKMRSEEAAGRVLGAAFNAFSPLGSGADSNNMLGTAFKTVLPSPLVPAFELASNDNHMGGPIAKGADKYSSKIYADSYMNFDNVNPVTRDMMRGLNSLTGGDKYHGGFLDFNPGKVDYFIQSYLPGIIGESYKGIGMAARVAEGESLKRTPLPVIDRFSAYTPQGKDQEALRNVSQIVQTTVGKMQDPNTSREKQAEIMKAHPNILAVSAIITGADQDIKKLQQWLKTVDNDPSQSEQYKVAFRQKVREQEDIIRNRAVRVAVKGGFRDEALGNGTDAGFLNKVGGVIRGQP